MKYIRKIFRKTNISNPLICTSSCAYQGVRNVSFPENFAYLLNGWPLSRKNLRFLSFFSLFENSSILRTRENTRPRFCGLKTFFKIISDRNEKKRTYQERKLAAAQSFTRLCVFHFLEYRKKDTK